MPLVSKRDAPSSWVSSLADAKKCRKSSIKECNIFRDLKLSNRFDCLKENDEHILVSMEMKKDENIFGEMLTIGSRNIFKLN